MSPDFLELPLSEVVALTQSGALAARELVALSLERIADSDAGLRAFVCVEADEAMLAAARLDELPALSRGPLHGVPVAVKDIFDVQGLPTRRGCAAFADAVPAGADAEAVRRLRAAGAVVVGKTQTHELACGVYTPPTTNPWDTARSAGGSSGGSGAAVASCQVFAAIGSDTGGSVRIPAALCGIVGFKPTYGRISRHGTAALAWSLDHVGPLTRTAEDASRVFSVLAGPDPRDPATLRQPAVETRVPATDPRGLRLGVPAEVFLDGVQPAVADVWQATLAELSAWGAQIVPVSIPELASALEIEFTIVLAEAATYYDALLAVSESAVGDGVREMLTSGSHISAKAYLAAQRDRARLCEAFQRAFIAEDLHALVTPTLPGTAQRHDQVHLNDRDGETVVDAFVRTTAPYNLTGTPCVSLFAGLGLGLPVGVQLAARPHGDGEVLALAAAVESVLGTAQPAQRSPEASGSR